MHQSGKLQKKLIEFTFITIQCLFDEFTFEGGGRLFTSINHATWNRPHQIITSLNRNHFNNIPAIEIKSNTAKKTNRLKKSIMFKKWFDMSNPMCLLPRCSMFHHCAIGIPFPSRYNWIGCMIYTPAAQQSSADATRSTGHIQWTFVENFVFAVERHTIDFPINWIPLRMEVNTS